MNDFLIILFWGFFSFPVITFLFYPFIIKIFSFLIPKIDIIASEQYLPKVSLIIVAYNEEKIIRQKIENSLSLNYPKHLLEIIIHTDGSNDDTNQIVAEYLKDGIILLTNEHNRGKTISLNDAIAEANSQILIFSDANSMYEKDAVKNLVRWMKNEKIGCVCGRLVYLKKGISTSEKGERAYWDWDTKIKMWEGNNGYLLGGNGAIFALRKNLAVVLPGNQSNDMILPIVARLRNYYVMYEPNAIAKEETASSLLKEYKRKVRIISRGLNGVVFTLKFLMKDKIAKKLPLQKMIFFLFQLFCKKFLRYLAFPAVLMMMLLVFFLPEGITLIVGQLMWFGFGVIALLSLLKKYFGKQLKSLPDFSYILLMAWAGCMGFYIFLTGKSSSRWRSQR